MKTKLTDNQKKHIKNKKYCKNGLRHIMEYIKDTPQDSHEWQFNNGIEYALEQLKLK